MTKMLRIFQIGSCLLSRIRFVAVRGEPKSEVGVMKGEVAQ